MEMINPYSFPGLKMTGLSKEKYPYLTYENYSVTRDEIIQLVCKECEVAVEDISSTCRKTEIVNCRKMLSAALKIKLNLSLVSIGELMGGRDHTTIRNLLLKFKDHCQYDDSFRQRARLILNKLGADFQDNYIGIKDNR
jgi:chromosomal replication initiation ATPase DnaA